MIDSSQMTNFFAARCPSCGGDLQLPTSKTSVKCMYCQNEIIINHNEHGFSVATIDIDKLENLMTEAYIGKNYLETIDYANKIIEVDDNALMAWYYKGISAGYLSTADNFRLSEMLHIVKRVLDKTSAKLTPETIETLVFPMVEIVLFEFTFPIHHEWVEGTERYKDSTRLDIQRSNKSVTEQLLLARGVGNNVRRYMDSNSNIYMSKFFPTIMEVVNYSWKMASTEKIAEPIVKLYLYLINCNVHLANNEIIISAMSPVISEIKRKFPTLETRIRQEFYPDKEKEKKDCFIVTATMGDISHPYVITLRRFRDLHLQKSAIGKFLIRVYNVIGPPLAQFISTHPLARTASRNLIVKPTFTVVIKVFGHDIDT